VGWGGQWGGCLAGKSGRFSFFLTTDGDAWTGEETGVCLPGLYASGRKCGRAVAKRASRKELFM
jgi:hypothetical protein